MLLCDWLMAGHMVEHVTGKACWDILISLKYEISVIVFSILPGYFEYTLVLETLTSCLL